MGKIAPGLGEGAEIRKRLHRGDAREFLAEVVGVAAAVVRGMQETVNGVEEVFLAQTLPFAFRRIRALEMHEARVGDGIAAGAGFCGGCFSRYEKFAFSVFLVFPSFIVEVEWEILRSNHVHRMKTRDVITDKY